MSDAPRIHFYTPDGQTFPDRLLCKTPDRGLNTNVTEYGNVVTCPLCLSILRERERAAAETEPSNPWAES